MGRIYRRGKQWGIDYRDADGKRVRESIGDKSDALEALRERERNEMRIKEGIIERVNNRVALADVYEAYREHIRLRNRAQTIRSYLGHLDGITKFLNVEFIDQITPSAVEGFMNQRAGVCTARTVNMSLIALKTMLKWAVDSRLVASNPAQGVKKLRQVSKKYRRALTEEEVTALLGKSPARYRRIWYCFLTTGLRHGELTALQWDDIDFEGGKIRVRGEVSKNWHEGGLPMQAGLRDMLERMAAETGEDVPSGPVFRNKRGGAIRNNLLRAFKSCVKAAGVAPGGVDIHCLRYTFGAHLIRRGANIKTAQRLMRHKTASMTLDVYAQYFADDGQAAVESLPFEIGTDTARSQTQRKPAAANREVA